MTVIIESGSPRAKRGLAVLNYKQGRDLQIAEQLKLWEGGGPNVGVHSAPGWSGLLSAHV